MPDWFTPESPEPQGPAPQKYVLEWKKLGFYQPLSREVAIPPGVTGVELSIDDALGFCSELILLKLKAFVLTHPLAEHEVTRTKAVEWPATPWQHWKQRHSESWWLRWFVQRWPVRMQQQVVDFREAWQEMAAYPWQDRLPRLSGLGKPTRMVEVLAAEWNVGDTP